MELLPAEHAKTLRAQIRLDPGESLCGIVDGARDLELAFEAKCLYKKEIWNLFESDVAEALADVAPYLTAFDPGEGYLENWTARLGKSAGILFIAASDPYKLYAHLRHILVVEDEEHQPFFFRFYDPRVLRIFLPTCTSEQLDEFFGPVRAWICESAEGDGYIEYIRGDQGQFEEKRLVVDELVSVDEAN
ncbi:MAG TPA: DUF4123 domain-containing protein [Terrimicrobiaceae bacterium]